MIYIDKCAYTNKLTEVHPLEKFIFALATITVCLTADTYIIPCLVVAIMAYLTIFRAGIPLKFYIRLMILPLGFLVLAVSSVAINVVQSNENIIWQFNVFNYTLGITDKSFDYSLLLLMRSFGAASCLYFLSLTTPLVDIMSILRRAKVPELFIELMTLIYRLIFILIMNAGRTHTSQTSRLGYSTLKNQYRSLGHLVSSLFINSYRKINDLFIALESRCYNGTMNVLEKEYKICPLHIILIILVEATLVYLEIITNRIA